MRIFEYAISDACECLELGEKVCSAVRAGIASELAGKADRSADGSISASACLWKGKVRNILAGCHE